MIVSRIYEGDIVRGVVQLKNRPCIVLKVLQSVVIAVPLTTENPVISKIEAETTDNLARNRFLKEKSYFTFSTVQIPIKDAKKTMLGTVGKKVLTHIKRRLKEKMSEFLKEDDNY